MRTNRASRRVLKTALITAAIAAALSAACQGPQGPTSAALSEARPFPSPPPLVSAPPLMIEARYYVDHRRVLGVDLPRDCRTLPIAVKLGLVPGTGASMRFDPSYAAPRLYLPDGAVLTAIAAETLPTSYKHVANRAADSALNARMLPEWGRAEEANLYFDLGAIGELFVRRTDLLRRDGKAVRALPIERALLGLDVEVDGRRRTLYVGIAPASGAKGS